MIQLPDYDTSAIGGGWSFISNFKKCFDTGESDIFFIPSASMVSREAVQQAKEAGKKIILRCDNIIRNSRNRNTGMSRMKDFAEWADVVVFQSEFAKDLLNPFLQAENTVVIMNSVDESIYNMDGRVDSDFDRYLYAKYSSDETKNFEMARLRFQKIYQRNDKAVLNLAGRFDSNLEEYDFDFYNNERYNMIGMTDSDGMAKVYKQSDNFLYSYFNDACSNTLIEALCCGLGVVDCYGMSKTGGTPEILDKPIDYFKLSRMKKDYEEVFDE